MPPCGTRDDALMLAVAKGDERAFAEIVQRHRAWLLSLLYAITHDEEQAQDLTQEVLSRIHRAAPGYIGQGNFVAWSKRIAINLGRNYLHQKRKVAQVSLSELDIETVSEDNNPMHLLLSKRLQEEIRQAIQSLPEEQRLAVIMRYFGDMSIKEIAWALQCPEGTTKSRLFHGLRRVRSLLEKASFHEQRISAETAAVAINTFTRENQSDER